MPKHRLVVKVGRIAFTNINVLGIDMGYDFE